MIINLLIIIIGFYLVINFRKFGKKAIEQRKKLNRKLPFPQNKGDFDGMAIIITQYLSLIIGIIFIFTGISKLLSS